MGKFYDAALAAYFGRSHGGSGTDPNAVHYTADSKTDSEKAQARSNIGAIGMTDKLSQITGTMTDSEKLSVRDGIASVGASALEGDYQGADLTVKFASEIANFADEWAWLKARITAKNYTGLCVHDYIPVTMSNNEVIKPEIAGINTYKGSAATEVPDHIDFITKDCVSETVQYNKVNYNNGIGCDKFTGDGSTTEFQLCRRSAISYPALASVTVGGAATSDYTYNASNGVLALATAPASGAVIKAVWSTPINCPFMASNVRAWLMSDKCGVPNETVADPALTEVDYTSGGVWGRLPAKLKNVIADKWSYPGVRYTAGTLRTSEDTWTSINLGKLWLPDECEVYGQTVFSSTYSSAYGRQYPCFFNGDRKKGAGNGGFRTSWWLLPAYSGGSTSACGVSYSGYANGYGASDSPRVPVCFRVTG